MATVKITDGFRDDLEMVESQKVLLNILDTIKILAVIPTMGSSDVPESIQKSFGDSVHKIPVKPFDIITIYNAEEDSVAVLGLVHQRAAW